MRAPTPALSSLVAQHRAAPRFGEEDSKGGSFGHADSRPHEVERLACVRVHARLVRRGGAHPPVDDVPPPPHLVGQQRPQRVAARSASAMALSQDFLLLYRKKQMAGSPCKRKLQENFTTKGGRTTRFTRQACKSYVTDSKSRAEKCSRGHGTQQLID